MSVEYICDGCGKRAPATHNGRDWFKPHLWFQRSDEDGPQDACSRPCIDKVADETGKTPCVLPV